MQTFTISVVYHQKIKVACFTPTSPLFCSNAQLYNKNKSVRSFCFIAYIFPLVKYILDMCTGDGYFNQRKPLVGCILLFVRLVCPVCFEKISWGLVISCLFENHTDQKVEKRSLNWPKINQ